MNGTPSPEEVLRELLDGPDPKGRVHELAEAIVRADGNESEKHGLPFALYPLWAVEKAWRMVEEGPRPEVHRAVEALAAWLPSETREFQQLVASLLAALPGGEELEETGTEPAPVGWKEAELLGDLLHSIQDSGDVRHAIRRLFPTEDA